MVRVMNTKSMSSRDIQSKSRVVLQSLFPSWLPPAFRAMFARPLPELSLHMNALITALACKWLMGETELNTVEVESSADGEVRTLPGVKVERCRYLEEIGCASACMNSCKFPTQEFFKTDMGIDVTVSSAGLSNPPSLNPSVPGLPPLLLGRRGLPLTSSPIDLATPRCTH